MLLKFEKKAVRVVSIFTISKFLIFKLAPYLITVENFISAEIG
jgi:hypothetical protein